jgi:hypothetical protein
MGGWVGASDKASTGRAEKARVGGVGDTENHRLKTSELYRQAKGRNPGARAGLLRAGTSRYLGSFLGTCTDYCVYLCNVPRYAVHYTRTIVR